MAERITREYSLVGEASRRGEIYTPSWWNKSLVYMQLSLYTGPKYIFLLSRIFPCFMYNRQLRTLRHTHWNLYVQVACTYFGRFDFYLPMIFESIDFNFLFFFQIRLMNGWLLFWQGVWRFYKMMVMMMMTDDVDDNLPLKL